MTAKRRIGIVKRKVGVVEEQVFRNPVTGDWQVLTTIAQKRKAAKPVRKRAQPIDELVFPPESFPPPPEPPPARPIRGSIGPRDPRTFRQRVADFFRWKR